MLDCYYHVRRLPSAHPGISNGAENEPILLDLALTSVSLLVSVIGWDGRDLAGRLVGWVRREGIIRWIGWIGGLGRWIGKEEKPEGRSCRCQSTGVEIRESDKAISVLWRRWGGWVGRRGWVGEWRVGGGV